MRVQEALIALNRIYPRRYLPVSLGGYASRQTYGQCDRERLQLRRLDTDSHFYLLLLCLANRVIEPLSHRSQPHTILEKSTLSVGDCQETTFLVLDFKLRYGTTAVFRPVRQGRQKLIDKDCTEAGVSSDLSLSDYG